MYRGADQGGGSFQAGLRTRGECRRGGTQGDWGDGSNSPAVRAIDSLWLFNIAMENGPFIDVFE